MSKTFRALIEEHANAGCKQIVIDLPPQGAYQTVIAVRAHDGSEMRYAVSDGHAAGGINSIVTAADKEPAK